jgi:hypothetical protein
MIITEKIEVSDKILASGGFGDVRHGKHMGHLVAVKSLKVAMTDDWLKIRKVSINHVLLINWGHGPNCSVPAILQRGHPLEFAVPPKCLETCRGSMGLGQGTIQHSFRVDGAREHHGVH